MYATYRPDTNESSFSFLIFSSTSRRVHEIFPGVQLPPAGNRCVKAGALHLTKIRKSTKGANSQSSYLMLVSQKNSCGNVAVGKYVAQVQTFT